MAKTIDQHLFEMLGSLAFQLALARQQADEAIERATQLEAATKAANATATIPAGQS